MRVEHQPAAEAEPLEGGGIEVAAQQRRDVQPLDPAQQHALRLVRPPRLADGFDGHRARAVGVVGEREARRLAAGGERSRQADGGELALEASTVVLAALREDHRLLAERVQGATGVPRRAADPRRGAGDDVARDAR